MGSKPGRKIIRWVNDDKLKKLKALAAIILHHEGLKWEGTAEEKEERLWIRVKEEIADVFPNETMHDLCDHAERVSKGQVLTPHKLWDRADKTLREPHEARAIKELIVGMCDDLDYMPFDFKDPFKKGPKRTKQDDRPLTSSEIVEVRELLRTRPWETSSE